MAGWQRLTVETPKASLVNLLSCEIMSIWENGLRKYTQTHKGIKIHLKPMGLLINLMKKVRWTQSNSFDFKRGRDWGRERGRKHSITMGTVRLIANKIIKLKDGANQQLYLFVHVCTCIWIHGYINNIFYYQPIKVKISVLIIPIS